MTLDALFDSQNTPRLQKHPKAHSRNLWGRERWVGTLGRDDGTFNALPDFQNTSKCILEIYRARMLGGDVGTLDALPDSQNTLGLPKHPNAHLGDL